MEQATGNPFLGFILLLVMLAIYFLPGIWAQHRKMKRRVGVWLLTVFLGWTFLGWVAALIWAASGDTDEKAQ
ncbi:MAG: superinfection immunity protein [Pseudomonadota bacterium]